VCSGNKTYKNSKKFNYIVHIIPYYAYSNTHSIHSFVYIRFMSEHLVPIKEEDSRLQLLKLWLKESLGYSDFNLSVASADASFRRYFRIEFSHPYVFENNEYVSLIVMDAPPEQESVKEFTRIAKYWYKHKISVPRVFAKNIEQGFLVLEDFGDTTFLQKNESAQDIDKKSAYSQALNQLTNIQSQLSIVDINHQLPAYLEKKLLEECLLFSDWYLEKHCSYYLSEDERNYLMSLFSKLNKLALKQPKVVVHRDYHSRNLMYRDNQSYGVIDFQDAVIGPLFYDSVSLLKDCYIMLPTQLRESLFNEYYDSIKQIGLFSGTLAEARLYFDLMGVQRHLKAIGIFSRLFHRDGKNGYLDDIPRTASYIMQLKDEYDELEPLVDILRKTVK